MNCSYCAKEINPVYKYWRVTEYTDNVNEQVLEWNYCSPRHLVAGEAGKETSGW